MIQAKVVEIVSAFPEAVARPVAGRHLKLEVRGKKFGWFMENHHGDGRLTIHCKAAPGVALAMVEANPNVYYIPSYGGRWGEVGIWLDVPGLDWIEIATLLYEACWLAAPKAVRAKLEETPPPHPLNFSGPGR